MIRLRCRESDARQRKTQSETMPSFLERVNNMSPSVRIMKNVVVVSAAFMVQFTAFQSMAALQSSINKVGLVTSLFWISQCDQHRGFHLVNDWVWLT